MPQGAHHFWYSELASTLGTYDAFPQVPCRASVTGLTMRTADFTTIGRSIAAHLITSTLLSCGAGPRGAGTSGATRDIPQQG